MKLTTFLAAFVGLDFVTASAIPAPRSLIARSARAHVKRGVDLTWQWQPADAYKKQPGRKRHWEEMCSEALTRAGCGVGVIHQPTSRFTRPDGKRTHYINVEGAPSMEMMNRSKKMRVFFDGTSEDLVDWSQRDRKLMQDATHARKTKDLQPLTDHKALLSWNPADPYKNQQYRKVFWEQKCGQALAREGCGAGTIHQGEIRSFRPDGTKNYSVNVDGFPSMEMTDMPKKMHVFEDGTSEVLANWSKRDRRLMANAKRPKATSPQPLADQTTLLSWDSAEAYASHNQRKRKASWEHRCNQALARIGCKGGTIHKGERTLTKPDGTKTSYIGVEGTPATAMEPGKKIRVFEDGTSEVIDDWSSREKTLMKYAQRLKTEQPLTDPKTLISWHPADTYGSRYQRKRKAFWEHKCDQAFASVGCEGGTIYKGERTWTKPDGTKTSYVSVQGAPAMGMESGKKMRVYEDGKPEDGWLDRDLRWMTEKKSRGRGYKKAVRQPLTDQKVLLFWNPANTYGNHPKRKLFWEQRCDGALARIGCEGGTIHKGQTKAIRNGKETSYVRVEATPSFGMDHGKRLRVFEDGSSQDFWDKRDRKLVVKGKQADHNTRRKRKMAAMGTPVEPSTSTQPPTEEQTQDSSKRRKVEGSSASTQTPTDSLSAHVTSGTTTGEETGAQEEGTRDSGEARG